MATETGAVTVDASTAQERAARDWYGYGRWGAPYWFIGPEPGMSKREGENLVARSETWAALGGCELMDCVAHHRAFGNMRHHKRTIPMKLPVDGHTMRPPTQPTWRQLIRVLLAFKGERTDNDAIGHYQCDKWGSAEGETCVAELSALAARSLSVKRDRTTFRIARTAHLARRALENAPIFVVMYGGGKNLRPCWDSIAAVDRSLGGFENTTIAGWEVGLSLAGTTKFVCAAHPVNGGEAAAPDDYWIEIGNKLRAACEGRPTDPRS